MADIITAANAGRWEPTDEFDLAQQVMDEEIDLAIDAQHSVAGATAAEEYADKAAQRVNDHMAGTYRQTGKRRPGARRTLDLSTEPEPERDLSDDELLAQWPEG